MSLLLYVYGVALVANPTTAAEVRARVGDRIRWVERDATDRAVADYRASLAAEPLDVERLRRAILQSEIVILDVASEGAVRMSDTHAAERIAATDLRLRAVLTSEATEPTSVLHEDGSEHERGAG